MQKKGGRGMWSTFWACRDHDQYDTKRDALDEETINNLAQKVSKYCADNWSNITTEKKKRIEKLVGTILHSDHLTPNLPDSINEEKESTDAQVLFPSFGDFNPQQILALQIQGSKDQEGIPNTIEELIRESIQETTAHAETRHPARSL